MLGAGPGSLNVCPSQFFPAPSTALGRVGGWPCPWFTGEDLMLEVPWATYRGGRTGLLPPGQCPLSPSGADDMQTRGQGVPLVNGGLFQIIDTYSAKGQVTPGAASRELPAVCPPVLLLCPPCVRSQINPEALGHGSGSSSVV